MVHSRFRRFGNLSSINQFSNKWHRLASIASDKKGAQIQHIFMIQTKKIFSKHQSEPEFKNLDDSLDLSSDLSNLRTSAVSINSSASMTSVASMTSTKHLLILMFGSSLAPKWPIPVPFCGMNHQNSNFFTDIWYPFFRRLLRPADVAFLKTGSWNSNVHTS